MFEQVILRQADYLYILNCGKKKKKDGWKFKYS